MKKFVCVLTVLVSIILGFIVGNSIKKEYKYAVHSSSGLTILYDKENGLAWRNVRCEKSDIPNCWQQMEYYGRVVPDGDQELRDKDFKETLKQSGLK